MKTDRELLALAARAAGIEIVNCTCSYEDWPFKYAEGQARRGHWNPLIHDGDALRLAVDLRMDLNINDDACDAFHSDGCVSEVGGESTRHVVRRAIVRAAASIGEAMP